jgi:hypothetical protein
VESCIAAAAAKGLKAKAKASEAAHPSPSSASTAAALARPVRSVTPVVRYAEQQENERKKQPRKRSRSRSSSPTPRKAARMDSSQVRSDSVPCLLVLNSRLLRVQNAVRLRSEHLWFLCGLSPPLADFPLRNVVRRLLGATAAATSQSYVQQQQMQQQQYQQQTQPPQFQGPPGHWSEPSFAVLLCLSRLVPLLQGMQPALAVALQSHRATVHEHEAQHQLERSRLMVQAAHEASYQAILSFPWRY